MPTTTTPTATTTTPTVQTVSPTASITPGVPTSPSQINIADASGQIATNPDLILNKDEQLSNLVPTVSSADTAAGTINDSSLQQNANTASQYNANVDTVNNTSTAANQTEKNAAPVTTKTTSADVANADMQAVHGTVDPNAIVNADQTGIDTSTYDQTATGQALNQAAQQNFSNIIDTNTLAGKLLAQQLGEGNYTDSKATLKGQLDTLQSEFQDPTTGEPKIPSWAAGTARNVSRIAAFSGMTGTAATAAMAQAIMEASLPIAQADSQFFQTLTVKNLDNRQQSTINRANVLAKIDLANMDQRMTAAVTNAQKFMQMDMQNLTNDQQAQVINTQDRVQSILEDAKAENTNRLFVAQSQNEKDTFYANLNSSIDQFNSAQTNGMSQFNASQTNAIEQFNSAQENNRDQFYKNMQFQVDTANTKWRQTITMTQNQQQFEAAATDVKNKVGITTEQLNRLWDRSDSLLDYAWKTADNEADRQNQINLMKLQNNAAITESNNTGTGSLLGTLLGIGGKLVMGALGI
jgi:hypothetical protein